ncbi:MAG: glycosyltransferase, partial [Verrucomicrobiota bacterium]
HQWHVQTGRPYVISAQGMLNRWAIHHQAWKKRIAAFLYEKKNLRGASCLHALSEQEIEDYRDYGLSNPVALIPNGVDIPDEPDQSVSAPWSNVVPAGSKVLFFMGRIHQKKGLIELLKGWSCAGPLRKEWRLVIAGWDDGGYELLVRKQIEESGLTREVFLIGSQFGEAKEAALFKADAFILPSHSEGLPIALLEAWAHRLPVLMTPQCNLPIGFTCGAAIPILPNPESIAEGLEKLFMMSNAERVGMGCKGRELIEARFTWKIVAGEMRTVYEWLAGMGPKPGCIVDGK